MTVGSKEFYDLRNQFEKDITKASFVSIRLDKEDKTLNKVGRFYQDGLANQLFQAYMLGYASHKCLTNLDNNG